MTTRTFRDAATPGFARAEAVQGSAAGIVILAVGPMLWAGAGGGFAPA